MAQVNQPFACGHPLWIRAHSVIEWFLFPQCLENPEDQRKARLIVGFGLLGSLFCFTYALLYWRIGHFWGSLIVGLAGIGAFASPFLMKIFKSMKWAAHLLLLIMTVEFFALCSVEDLENSHALAWLSVVPLCALLLTGRQQAKVWMLICLLAGALICVLSLSGYDLPARYEPRYALIVTCFGYLGLILFLFLIGVLFESGRQKALVQSSAATAKLELSNQRLMALDREKTELMGIVAHDLKNPLTTIMLSAELMDVVPDSKTLTANITGAGTRMRDLIEGLLKSNAVEEIQSKTVLKPCEINRLLRQSIGQNMTSADRKGIALEFSGEAEIWVQSDESDLNQIFDNLISNAVKYSPLDSTVYIQSRLDKNDVYVSIKDSGPGISRDDQKRLFQKFVRLSAIPTGGESSNGLGLSIVKKLAESLGGSVSCESSLGSGSTFSFSLPVGNKAKA